MSCLLRDKTLFPAIPDTWMEKVSVTGRCVGASSISIAVSHRSKARMATYVVDTSVDKPRLDARGMYLRNRER
jgi:hypothetical protein